MASRVTLLQIFRYLLMTGVSAVFTLGMPVLLHEVFSVEVETSVAIALSVAFVINFLTTRYYVFEAKSGAKGQAVRYVFTSIAFRVSEYLAFLVLHTLLHVYYTVALIIIMFTSLIFKFIVNRIYVFRAHAAESE